MEGERHYHVQVNIEVPPSSASTEQTTEASKALAELLLDYAEEYKDRIPEQLFVLLNNLAKVEHECVPYESFRRRSYALNQVAAELHMHREQMETMDNLIMKLQENAKLKDESIKLMDEKIKLFEKIESNNTKTVSTLRAQLKAAFGHNELLMNKLSTMIEFFKKKKLSGQLQHEVGLQTRYNLRQGVAGVAGKRKR